MSYLLSPTSTAIYGLAQRLASTAALCQRCASTSTSKASTPIGRTPSSAQTRDEHLQFGRRSTVSAYTSPKAGARRQPPPTRLQTAKPRNRFSARASHPASAHSRSSQTVLRSPFPPDTPRSAPRGRATRDSFNLAEHLARLCSAGKLDEAVETIRTSRTVAVNAAVYGIIIGHVLRAKRKKLAWKLWMEMKRSGVIPSPRTYTTYFSSIDPKSVTSADLENLRKIYAQYLSFVQSSSEPRSADETRARPPLDPEYAPSPIPRNAYLTLLAQVPLATLEDVSAVYESGSPGGALAFTRETHSTYIRSLGAAFADAKDAELPELLQKLKAASDRALEAHRTGQARLDARAVGAIIHAWRSANFRKRELPDKETRLEVIDNLAELFGLPRLDSPSSKIATDGSSTRLPASASSEKVVRPTRPIRADALALHYAFALANQFRSTCEQACMQWFDAIREGVPSVPVALLDTRICEIVMKACPASAADVLIWQLRSPSASLRPELSTYTLGMRQSSYVPALRMLAHMTGKNDKILEPSEKRLLGLPLPSKEASASVADSQADQATAASKRALKGYHTKHIEPDARCLSILLEKALETRDWRRLDRALRVALTFACTRDIGSKFGPAAPARAGTQSAVAATEGEQAFVAAAEKILEKLTDNRQISDEAREYWRDTRSAFPPMSRIIASKGRAPIEGSSTPSARSSEISSRF